MAKKKEFFSTFDKNLSIKEEVAAVTQAPPATKTTSISKATNAVAEPPAAAKPVVLEKKVVAKAPVASQPTKLIKKKPAATTAPELTKNTSLARPTTFRIDVDLMESIKAVAYWERKKIQDVLNDALTEYINKVPKQELARASKAYRSAN